MTTALAISRALELVGAFRFNDEIDTGSVVEESTYLARQRSLIAAAADSTTNASPFSTSTSIGPPL